MSADARAPLSLRARLRRWPASSLEWTWRVTGAAAVLVVLAQLRAVIAPVWSRTDRLTQPAWDAPDAARYLTVRSLLRFHELPSWNPYACGGHPAWGAPGGAPNLVSPLLPLYLMLPMGRAIALEIVLFALVSAVGTWRLASRFTRSPVLCAMAVVVFAVNARWAMQLAAGHAWHLTYALVPWALFFLDRATGAERTEVRRRGRDVVWVGVCLALLVYFGGAALLPPTLLLFVTYATWLAASTRSVRPLGLLAASLAVGAGLAAPKLVPMIEVAARLARVTTSAAIVSPQALSLALLDATQTLRSNVPGIRMDAWCEVGCYLGSLGVAWLTFGALFARGGREQPLRACAAVFVVLGLGPFHEYAPWTLVRRLPVLATQEMPSRWLALGVLALACCAAGVGERVLTRAGRGRPWLEGLVLVAVAWVAFDTSRVARAMLEETPLAAAAPVAEQFPPFVQETRLPREIQPAVADGAPASYPAERANVGTIECDALPGLANYAGIASRVPGYEGRPNEIGAHGRGEPEYRGEAFVAEGHGTATIVAWSPDRVEVRVDGAQPGDHVVLNENADPGWSAAGADVTSVAHAVAATLRAGSGSVTFRYRPRGLWLGLLLFVATVGALAWLGRQARRMRHAREL